MEEYEINRMEFGEEYLSLLPCYEQHHPYRMVTFGYKNMRRVLNILRTLLKDWTFSYSSTVEEWEEDPGPGYAVVAGQDIEYEMVWQNWPDHARPAQVWVKGRAYYSDGGMNNMSPSYGELEIYSTVPLDFLYEFFEPEPYAVRLRLKRGVSDD